MDVIIETERLLLRKFTLEDTSLIYELNLDPEVIRYTYDPIKDLEQARQVLEKPFYHNMIYIITDAGQSI